MTRALAIFKKRPIIVVSQPRACVNLAMYLPEEGGDLEQGVWYNNVRNVLSLHVRMFEPSTLVLGHESVHFWFTWMQMPRVVKSKEELDACVQDVMNTARSMHGVNVVGG